MRRSFCCSAPLLVVLFSILLPGHLVALDLDLMLRGTWSPFPRGPAIAVALQNGYAFVAAETAGLVIIDVSDPADPQRLGGYDTSGGAADVAVSGNYAYVAAGDAGLQVIDVSNPANPQRIGGYDTSGEAWGVAISGNLVYVADYATGMQVIDVSNPAIPQLVGEYVGEPARGVTVSGNYAYLAGPSLQVVDVSNPANPRRVGGNRLFGGSDVKVAGNHVFVAAGGDGLVILDLFYPAPRLEVVSQQQPGQFRFLVHGDAGQSVRVQRSINLLDWDDWETITLDAIPSELSDLDAGAVPHNFYRTITP